MARPNPPTGTLTRLEVTDRRSPRRRRRGARIVPWLMLLGLAALIVVGGLTLLRPVIADWIVGLAESNPQALSVPFVADLVGERLGDRLTTPAGSDPTPVAFEVKAGVTADQVASALQLAGLLKDPFAFRYLAKTSGQETSIEAGTYELRQTMSPKDVLTALQSAQIVPVKVALREGLRIEQISAYLQTLPLPPNTASEFYDLAEAPTDALRADFPFLAELPEGGTLEGFLSAGTYDVYPWATGEDIVRLLLGQWARATAAADPIADAKKQGLDFYDVLTIASIVEREAGVDADRAKIAGVFWNRVKAKMPFESDVVVIYGADTVALSKIDFSQWPTYFFWAGLTSGSYGSYKLPAALAGYQSYQHVGMTAGPIVTPTLASIEAAIHPDTKDGYLYFVLKNDGSKTMAFAKTYAQHLRNVAMYLP
ncbi:MAG: endolytic transglycosylase MltG [Candidatus Limnocylindrales bacterium]